MKRTFGIIGGDQRQAELAKLLAAEGHEVYTYGLDRWSSERCTSLDRALSAPVVILPLPLCREEGMLNLSLIHICPPAAGTSGYEYVLYHVGKEHIAFCFAQRVFDLPGEFCYFLRFFGAGWSRRIVTDERSGENSFIFSFSRRSGVRR